MTNHKLDDEVEDILKHFGIKGMKWNVTRTDAQIAAAEGGGGAADVDDESDEEDEEDNSILDMMGDKMDDVLDAVESKMGDIKDSLKKSGAKLMASLFGSEPKLDPGYSKKMGAAMKQAMEQRKKDEVYKKYKDDKDARFEKHLGKQMRDTSKELEGMGYTKVKKSTKSLKERGYTVEAVSGPEGDKKIKEMTKGMTKQKR